MNRIVLTVVDTAAQARRITDELEGMGAIMDDFLVINGEAELRSRPKQSRRPLWTTHNLSDSHGVLLGVENANLDTQTIRSVIKEHGGRHIIELGLNKETLSMSRVS